MRSSIVVALFAGSVASQSTAVVINPLMPASTLTVLGSSSGTTTYVNSCPSGTGVPAEYLSSKASEVLSATSHSAAASSAVRSAETLVMTPTSAPSPTAAARLRRQNNFLGLCEPITLKQGSSSIGIHMQDPAPGVWTADMNCAWQGELTSADLTCTLANSGSFAKNLEIEGISSTTIKASELSEFSAIQTVTVVQPASNSASATALESQSGTGNATASGSGAPAQATGAAAGASLPKGALAFVGSAAGIFAAALAL